MAHTLLTSLHIRRNKKKMCSSGGGGGGGGGGAQTTDLCIANLQGSWENMHLLKAF